MTLTAPGPSRRKEACPPQRSAIPMTGATSHGVGLLMAVGRSMRRDAEVPSCTSSRRSGAAVFCCPPALLPRNATAPSLGFLTIAVGRLTGC